ncbi:MAG: DUF1294 domain-containing protein [Oscillospiraceae bacterium]|nr:DUF1294 domain-containing protein [Oscillospiraceae bacterium]
MKYFMVYLLTVSIAAVIMTVSDKSRAKKHKRRVSEKTLFITAALGGSAAMYITMLTIRHKTKHKRFMIGLPLIIFAQTAILWYLFMSKGIY